MVHFCSLNRTPLHHLQTIKCLLIVPNAESALNEEAGRLLLEEYDEYARRARLFTEIHARTNLLEQKRFLGKSAGEEAVAV